VVSKTTCSFGLGKRTGNSFTGIGGSLVTRIGHGWRIGFVCIFVFSFPATSAWVSTSYSTSYTTASNPQNYPLHV